MKRDLHIHTTCSDGVFSPLEILEMAKKAGANEISITDHDSVNAYSPEVFLKAKELGINLRVGVEISTNFNGKGVHVLGYDFDRFNSELVSTLNRLKSARQDYLFAVAEKLAELELYVETDKLSTVESVTKKHIALNVIENPKNQTSLMAEFGHVPSYGELIEGLMNEGCKAYTKKFTITPMEASAVIHSAGGKVVLAHPVAYAYEDGAQVSDIETLLDDMHADGVEANYLYVDRHGVLHDDRALWNDVAYRKNLMVTQGSDFHAFVNDGVHPTIGSVSRLDR